MGVKTIVRALAVAATMAGCGGADAPLPPPSAAETPQADDIVSSDARVQYFHDQLIAYGEDAQSDFGGALMTLDMHARDLQQDDPKHAYDTVLDKVRKVEDPAQRREMMHTFFNAAEAP